MHKQSFSPKGRTYEAPKMGIVVVESQGILCASGEGGTRGCIESMNMTDVNWP